MIKFNSSPEPTIGVEIELQLVDKKNLNLKNISSKILAEVNEKFSNELFELTLLARFLHHSFSYF